MNCKVLKKVATPTFLHQPPPFQGYLPFLAKFLVPPKLLNFWKVLPPFNKRYRGGGGGSNYVGSLKKTKPFVIKYELLGVWNKVFKNGPNKIYGSII